MKEHLALIDSNDAFGAGVEKIYLVAMSGEGRPRVRPTCRSHPR